MENNGRDLKIEDEKKIGRGMLTADIVNAAKLMIGRPITQKELRLIVYVHYVMCNERKIKPQCVNQEEREIMRVWKNEGHIEGGMTGLSITKQWWDFMSEVIFLGYVGFDNDEINGDMR